MNKNIRFSAEDWMGVWVVAVLGGGMFAFREFFIVPRASVGMCAAANAPAICVPRAAVLWLQYQQAFGWVALVLGILAFCTGRRWPAAFAIGIGIAAVVNFNATTGIIGAALAIIAWIGAVTGRYPEGVSK